MTTGQAMRNLKVLFKQKDYWIISLGTFGRYGIYAAFQALWAGPYLMEVLGLSALTTGNLILLLNLGMILGSPIWGTLSDRVFKTRKWVIVAGLAGIVLTIIVIASMPADLPLSRHNLDAYLGWPVDRCAQVVEVEPASAQARR